MNIKAVLQGILLHSCLLGNSMVLQAQDNVAIKELVSRLDLESYKSVIKGLTQFGDRRQGTSRNQKAVDWIEQQLGDNLVAIALALFIGALAMLFTENKRARKRQQAKEKANRDRPMLEALDELSYAQALTIGFAQCLALWPGMSRSMVTIIGGYWVGLAPQKAAEYSFLLGLITLSAASAYKVFTDGAALSQTLALKPMLLGCAVAFFSAIYAIRFLVSCLNRYGLAPFALYRIGLAVIILVLFLPKM